MDVDVARAGARVVVLDPSDRLLLLHARDPLDSSQWWFTPGGGLDPGESPLQAARRELREETGLLPRELTPLPWWRRVEFDFAGQRYRQEERYFLARVDRTGVRLEAPTDLEREVLLGHRWWGLADLAATKEVVYPRRLADLVAALVAGEVSLTDEPQDIGE